MRSKVTTFRLQNEVFAKLERLSLATGLNRNAVVAQLIADAKVLPVTRVELDVSRLSASNSRTGHLSPEPSAAATN